MSPSDRAVGRLEAELVDENAEVGSDEDECEEWEDCDDSIEDEQVDEDAEASSVKDFY